MAFHLNNRQIPAASVAVSYQAVVVDKQFWRILTAALSHKEVFHLLFNVTGLWNVRQLELEHGTWFYVIVSLWMVAVSSALSFTVQHRLRANPMLRRLALARSVGLTSLVIAWSAFDGFSNIKNDSSVLVRETSAISIVLVLGCLVASRSGSFLAHCFGVVAVSFTPCPELLAIQCQRWWVFDDGGGDCQEGWDP